MRKSRCPEEGSAVRGKVAVQTGNTSSALLSACTRCQETEVPGGMMTHCPLSALQEDPRLPCAEASLCGERDFFVVSICSPLGTSHAMIHALLLLSVIVVGATLIY